MLKIWYYKPWAFNPKVNPQYVFDAKGKNVTERKREKENVHPLDTIARIKIRSSMIEVPGN